MIDDFVIGSGCVMEFAMAKPGDDLALLDWRPVGITAGAKKRKPRLTKKINKRIMAEYWAKRGSK
jgi:hypothetical protein